ncbi:transcription initiation factor IID, 18kD subunit-domain-containing protein [Mycena albidolilacea]|uniref:Transcription initiation factor TFIID subunit 13 n=1 Tax=Mycena albidolilacea TaxID=1033008 RepID=A0AAD7EQU1_9AGAR|nr:transcription initiation factor IID, 18kD subunit-domain-containing protein [Mycena albidolilacea]
MSQQSYGHYAPSGAQTPPPASAAYPYGAYPAAYPPHTPYPQTPGTYPYQAAGPYQYTAWKYAYPYPQQPQTPAAQPRPAPVTPAPAASTRTSTPNPPQRSSTFSSYTPSHLRESVAAAATGGATGRGARKQSSLRGSFTKELKNLMYGFGDDRNPANDTVNVMEEILIEYITDVCQTAGAQTKRVRLSIEDLRRALSRPPDAKKLARMEELLFMQEDIKRARAQFSEDVVQHA